LERRCTPAYPEEKEQTMNDFPVLDLVMRWLHVLPAVTMVGATIFMRVAMVPTLAELPDAQRKAMHAAMRQRWAKVVMISIALLLISGFVNYIRNAQRFSYPGYYHPSMGIKMLLALPIFFIASRLSGRSAGAEKFRENAPFWLNVNIALALIVVCLGGVGRVAAREVKAPRTPITQHVVPASPATFLRAETL
jgi:uncharacterized membrane protein